MATVATLAALSNYWWLYVARIYIDGYRWLLVGTDGNCKANMADHDIDGYMWLLTITLAAMDGY